MFRLLFILLISLFLLFTPTLQAISDTNQNGVSDPWEKFFNQGSLYTTFNPTADSDGDGWTNSQEAIVGTDPRSGNPLTGQVRPKLTHTRAVFSTATSPTLLTPEAITLTWPTLAGKKYTLFFSPNLTAPSWTQIGEPRIGAGTEIGTGIPLTQPDGTTPAAGFWRVTIADIDTDNDTLTDAEEHQLGSSPYSSDTDSDGLTDVAELVTYRTNPTSRDTDRDGVSDSDEVLLNFTNPLTATDADSDGIPDDLEKDFARQFLAFQPTSAAWGTYYAGLVAGNLDSNHDYTGDGVSVGTIASTIKGDDSANPTSNSLSYLVESQERRSHLTGTNYPIRGEQPARTEASLFQSLTDDSTNRIDFNQPGDLSYQRLNSHFHLAVWIPKKYSQRVGSPMDIHLSGINRSFANFYSFTTDNGELHAYGTYMQKRFRVFSRNLSYTSFNQTLLKITSKSPSGVAGTSLNTTYKAELLPFASQSGRFYSNWVEIQTTMSSNQDEYAGVSKVNLISDLNNDGGISNTDNSLLDAALLSGATDEIKDKGTEFIFQNDNLSNGIWDKDDPDPARPATAKDDDDAEFIDFGLTIYRGEVWLDHPAIAGLSFYKTRECKAEDKVNFSPNSKFSVSSSNPIPNGLYVRVDGELAYPEANPQFEGDLVLKIKVDPNAQELQVAKMKLTVVKQLEAKKYFHTARDYIMENNTKLAARNWEFPVVNPTTTMRVCAMREESTTLHPMETYNFIADPQAPLGDPVMYGLAGIESVINHDQEMTVVINGNQCGFSNGMGTAEAYLAFLLGEPEMTDKCQGRIVVDGVLSAASSDHYNPATNAPGTSMKGSYLAGPDPIPGTGGPGGKYFAQYPDGRFVIGTGQMPANFGPPGTVPQTSLPDNGIGGLSGDYELGERVNYPNSMIGFHPMKGDGEGVVFASCGLNFSAGNGKVPEFYDAAKSSGVPEIPGATIGTGRTRSIINLLLLDSGNTSPALAHQTPNGNLKLLLRGSKHIGNAYYTNTFLRFKSERPRQ